MGWRLMCFWAAAAAGRCQLLASSLHMQQHNDFEQVGGSRVGAGVGGGGGEV
jgi:hypothetical protein